MIWLVNFLARLLSLLILLRVVASWIDPERGGEFFRFLRALTEPVLAPLRRLVYRRGMRYDLSPLAALACIEILRWLILGVLGRGS